MKNGDRREPVAEKGDKFMKKLLAIVMALTLVLTMTACGDTGAEEVDTLAATGNNATDKTEFNYEVVQDRVIELDYDAYDYDGGIEYLYKLDPLEVGGGGCSAVRVMVDGKVYVGRDYDFYCSDTPAFIVRNNAGKYKTIGIGNSPASLDPWSENYEIREGFENVAPFLCCDVMSEAGLYAEVNIRPLEDGFACNSTNEGATRACTQCFLQLMLSNYGSIDEIIEHVNDYDWYDLNLQGFEEAVFVTDQSGRSVIFEFAADEVRYQEAEYNANFYINDEWYEKETIGCGEMRLAKELAYKPYVRTEEDIFTMMEKGAYTQFYQADVDPEYAGPEYYEITGYNKITAEEDHDGYIAATEAKIKELSQYSWETKIEKSSWESTFITAANVTDLKIHTHFSEHYGIDFEIGFE